jgi:hypothetical protein
MKKNRRRLKRRSPVALAAKMRRGAGAHRDKKKERNRRKCREKVDINDV